MDVAGDALNVVLAYPPSRQAVPAHQDKRVRYKSNNMCVPGGVELDAASGEGAMKGWRVRMPLARATPRDEETRWVGGRDTGHAERHAQW